MNGNIEFKPWEKEFVAQVSAVARRNEETALEVGRLTEELVAKAGGITYGEQTIARVARHPEIGCTAQYIRECWAIYRLDKAHGAELSRYPGLSKSTQYQLARVLGTKKWPKSIPADKVDEEKKKLVFACAATASELAMTAEEVGGLVSAELDKLGLLRKSNRQKQSPPASKKPALHALAASSAAPQPELATGNDIDDDDPRGRLIRLLNEAMALSQKLAEEGPDAALADIVADAAKKLVAAAKNLRMARRSGAVNVSPARIAESRDGSVQPCPQSPNTETEATVVQLLDGEVRTATLTMAERKASGELRLRFNVVLPDGTHEVYGTATGKDAKRWATILGAFFPAGDPLGQWPLGAECRVVLREKGQGVAVKYVADICDLAVAKVA